MPQMSWGKSLQNMTMISTYRSFVSKMTEKNCLQLSKIILKNYKTYKGDTSVDLSPDPNQPITILHGTMGMGKTTFLGAIYWCLYGNKRSENSLDGDETIINNSVLRHINMNQINETSVEIHLRDGDELRHKIKRTIMFTKTSESTTLKPNSSVGGRIPTGINIEEQIEYSNLDQSDEWIVSTNPDTVNQKIENLFPESLSSYFLFDAELLDKFFSYGDNKNVKNGIEQISGLPILDHTIKHLNDAEKSTSKEMKGVELEPINSALDHIDLEIGSYREKIDRANKRIDEIKTEMDSLESYLKNHDEAVIRELQKRRDVLRDGMSDIKKQSDKESKSMKNWLLHANITARLYDSMKTCLDQCQVWETEGKIPIAVSGYALRNILDANNPKCICGADLSDGSEGRKHIEVLLTKDLAESPVIQGISTGRGNWEDMILAREQMATILDEFRATRGNFNRDYNEKKAEIKSCEDQLSKHDTEKVRSCTARLSDLRADHTTQNNDKVVAQDRLEEAERRRADKERERNILVRQQHKYTAQMNRIAMTKKIVDILSQCKRELIDEMRNTVEKKTTDYFLRLVSRKGDFSKVEIRENYKTIVLGTDQKSKSLSAGQTCCLALSYIAAIRDIAEKNYFMLIDSPLHNISAEERVDFAKNLPDFIPGTQITLLVQDQEYTGTTQQEGGTDKTIQSVRETLMANQSVWKEYNLRLVHDSDDGSTSTTIEEGTWQ